MIACIRATCLFLIKKNHLCRFYWYLPPFWITKFKSMCGVINFTTFFLKLNLNLRNLKTFQTFSILHGVNLAVIEVDSTSIYQQISPQQILKKNKQTHLKSVNINWKTHKLWCTVYKWICLSTKFTKEMALSLKIFYNSCMH